MQFLGAAGFVTGSRTLLEYNGFRLYVDCGLYQGPKFVEERNYLPLESAADTIDAIAREAGHPAIPNNVRMMMLSLATKGRVGGVTYDGDGLKAWYLSFDKTWISHSSSQFLRSVLTTV